MEAIEPVRESCCQGVSLFNVFVIGMDAYHVQSSLTSAYWSSRKALGLISVLPAQDGEDGIEVTGANSAVIHVQSVTGGHEPHDLVSVRNSMKQYRDAVQEMVQGAQVNILCATLGDSFSSGITPVVSQVSAQSGAVTVGLLALPHPDDGHKYMHHSKWALEYTRPNLDALIMLPMEIIYNVFSGSTMTQNMGERISEMISQVLRGITDAMIMPGFRTCSRPDDIAGFFRGAGEILVGCQAIEYGPNGPCDAIHRCIHHPFHALRRFEGAQKVLVSVCCGEAGLPMEEYLRIGQFCRNELGNETDVLVGPFPSDRRGEKPFVVVFGRDLIEKRRDGFDYPVAELPPEKAPPRLPAYYRKYYGASRSVMGHDVSNF
ncbi:hypothetical protein JXA80_08505 [bacterium]|nr:hypothetical protein [candidate division CSSED10-310 bacterium]